MWEPIHTQARFMVPSRSVNPWVKATHPINIAQVGAAKAILEVDSAAVAAAIARQLNDAAIDANGLSVDPCAVRAGKHRDTSCNVLRFAEPLERCQFCQTFDEVLRLSVKE